jgi:hypothetical protein
VNDYTDDAFADALRELGTALRRLEGVRDSLDANEPLRDRIDDQLREMAAACAELERLLDEASQELL